MNTILKEKLDILVIFLVLFLPIALITGPFLSDLSIILLSLLFLYKYRYEKIFINNYNYLIFFLIFSLLLIICSLLSEFILHSLESSLFYFRFIIFAYAMCYFFLKLKTLPNKFFYVLLVTLLFINIDAIYQYFFGFNLLGFENKYPWTPEFGDGEYHRVSGVFRDELKLGSFISKLLPIFISLFFFIQKYERINIFIFIAVIVLSTITILITSERLALINTIVFILISFVLIDINKKYKIMFLLLSTISIISFLYFDKNLNARISTVFDSFNSSEYIYNNFNDIKDDIPQEISIFTNQHAKHYITALRLFNDNYILGVGPKNFRQLCDKEPYRLKYSCSTHPHNTYMQLLSETGLLGFIFIICLFCYHALILFKIFFNKYIFNNQNNNSLTCIYILIFINLWPIAPSGSFYNNWNSIMFYIPFGMLLFYKSYEEYNK